MLKHKLIWYLNEKYYTKEVKQDIYNIKLLDNNIYLPYEPCKKFKKLITLIFNSRDLIIDINKWLFLENYCIYEQVIKTEHTHIK